MRLPLREADVWPRLPMGLALMCCAMLAGAAGSQDSISLSEAAEAHASALGIREIRFGSPGDGFLAWVDAGDLVVAREPDFSPRALAVGGEDEAVDAVHPSGDGSSVFVVRHKRRAPSERELLLVDIEGGRKPALVARGKDIPAELVPAPGGGAFAFVEGTMLHEYRRSSRGAWERKALLDPQDPRHRAAVALEGVVYSPDARRIAFVSERKAKQSYLAVHDTATGKTQYIEPSVFQDRSPVWSPDGARLAFMRVPVNLTMQYRFTSEREGVPWSILAANLETNEVRTVWRADRGPGSIPSEDSLIWAPSGEIAFRWEKTGWNLLYAVPAEGGTARLLTPGDGEVTRPRPSADGKLLYYAANIGDPMRWHIWRVPLASGRPEQLTQGSGVEGSPRVSAGGYISYFSDNREDGGPPQLVIRGPDGHSRALPVLSAAVASRNRAAWKHFLPTETMSVAAVDGLVSHHVVVRPKAPPPPGGYPVIVNAHGGPSMQTLPGAASWAYLFGQYAARNGYLYVDMNYRGSSGFGLEYRHPEGVGAMGGSEDKDLAALADHLRGRPDVDGKRIGIMGSSYGGHIVGLAMSRLPEAFAAGVSLFGVADWVVEMKKDQEEEGWASAPPPYIRLSERTRIEELAYASSPTPRIDRWRGPTLFTIGDLDKKGHVESVTDIAYQLIERGVPVEIHVDPAGGHNVFPQERVLAFFRKHMQ